ncbi:MAG: hypothetical protein CL562_06230 [Alphaproteobacteria bacterium]|nr:hypothetical protein [Alphaproteobacteria bacterium]
MDKNLGFGLLAGLISGAAYVSGQYGSLPGVILANFSALPLFLAGLSLGKKSSIVAGTSAILTVIFMSNPLIGGFFSISIAIPSWLIISYALKYSGGDSGQKLWYPTGKSLAPIILYASCLVSLILIFYSFRHPNINEMVGNTLKTLLANNIKLINTESFNLLTSIFPGMVAAIWIVMLTVNCVLAQKLLIKYQLANRPTPIYKNLSVPEWVYWGFISAFLVGFISNGNIEYIGQNLTVIFAVPFVYAGLGCIHILASNASFSGLLITLTYTVIFILGWPLLVVFIIGFFKEWFRLKPQEKTS